MLPFLLGISSSSARRTTASLALELFEQHQGTHILQVNDENLTLVKLSFFFVKKSLIWSRKLISVRKAWIFGLILHFFEISLRSNTILSLFVFWFFYVFLSTWRILIELLQYMSPKMCLKALKKYSNFWDPKSARKVLKFLSKCYFWELVCS